MAGSVNSNSSGSSLAARPSAVQRLAERSRRVASALAERKGAMGQWNWFFIGFVFSFCLAHGCGQRKFTVSNDTSCVEVFSLFQSGFNY
jgi:hypothetical protein